MFTLLGRVCEYVAICFGTCLLQVVELGGKHPVFH